MSQYNPHLDEMTVPVWSPLHRRKWMITPRQYALITKIRGFRVGTQRDLAEESGYSIAGVHRAIESLVTGGIVGKLARRGRKGWTRLVLKAGVHLMKASEENVPERGTGSSTTTGVLSETATLLGNISSRVSPRQGSPRPLGDLFGVNP